jgi:hypothetical protein
MAVDVDTGTAVLIKVFGFKPDTRGTNVRLQNRIHNLVFMKNYTQLSKAERREELQNGRLRIYIP